MQAAHQINWEDPIALAEKLISQAQYCVFLYSGENVGYSGQYSILALNPSKHLKSNNFGELEDRLTGTQSKFENAWFGYLGYGLKNCLEKLPIDNKNRFNLPNIWITNYKTIIVFNHLDKKINIYGDPLDSPNMQGTNLPATLRNNEIKLHSNMSKNEYLNKVREIKSRIINGDIYQANLTRKFYGTFNDEPNNFALFKKLAKISPSPYSSFIKLDDKAIISSSPEQFINITDSGDISSRPIKGSATRFSDPQKDQQSLKHLQTSKKDQAENLMIVDLVRNDLSRSCKIGTIKVSNLFETKSHPTIHHMQSTICGVKRESTSTLQAIKHAFPPGSMTGTPKIKAMEICSELEQEARGVYSGAIGWFGGDGSADFSVVIRTLIIDAKGFEFQVGGAITCDSNPELEWQETITKSVAIMRCLDIKLESIKSI